jgi:hypothetical protein
MRRINGNNDNYHDLPDATVRSCQQEKSHTIDLIEFEYNSYESIERGHQSKQPTMDRVIIPLNRQYREPKAMSRADLRVSTVTTTFLPIERSAPASISVYSYSSSNLEEAHLRKHSTATYTYGYITRVKHAYGDRLYYKRNPSTEEDQPMWEALLPPRTSARAKCTYGEDTLALQLKHIDDEKLSLD